MGRRLGAVAFFPVTSTSAKTPRNRSRTRIRFPIVESFLAHQFTAQSSNHEANVGTSLSRSFHWSAAFLKRLHRPYKRKPGAASTAQAQQRLIANVPFDFVVGNARMPAGHYLVTETDDPAVVSIANTDGHDFTFVLTIAGSFDDAVAQPELVFKQYGGIRFLPQIVAADREGREIPLEPATMAETVDRVTSVLLR